MRDPIYLLTCLLCLPLVWQLARIDIREHRLPDQLTKPLFGLVAAGVAVAAVIHHDGSLALRAGVGALALGAFYFLLVLLGAGNGMGLGDAKLAPSLGALTAWAGLEVWLTAVMLTFLLGGVAGLWLWRKHGRHARMPFGPFMIVGSALAVLTA